MTTAQRAREERVAMIRGLMEKGHAQNEVAQMLGITRQAVNQLLHRHEYVARQKVQAAVKRGKIIKPGHCSSCKTKLDKTKLQGHHKDYSKPLEIVWLCNRCHKAEHGYPIVKNKHAYLIYNSLVCE